MWTITQRVAYINTQVACFYAELEGMKLLPVFEQLLSGWVAQGYELVSVKDYFADFDHNKLPRHEIIMGPILGRSGELALQGPRFLA